jgi:hypothetical protein
MKDTTEDDFRRSGPPVLTAKSTYVRIPADRVLLCGDEPTDVRVMAETVKELITETSTEMSTLELHVEWP